MLQTGAIILAAGAIQSEFRPMAVVGNDTLIQRNVKTLRESGAEKIVVVTGDRHTALERHLANSDVDFVYNENFAESQMFDSILLGLQALEGICDRVLILPIDVPMVHKQTISRMLTYQDPFVRPVYRGTGGHPVLFDCCYAPLLRQYKGDGGLREAIRALGIQPRDLEVDDIGVLLKNDSEANFAHIQMLECEQQNGQRPFHLNVRMSLANVSDFFWDESAMFLQLIDQTGSMQTACGCLHISYSKGWKMVSNIEAQLGIRLLNRVVGGPKGGGSQLTEQGHTFLRAYMKMQQDIRTKALEVFQAYFPVPEDKEK